MDLFGFFNTASTVALFVYNLLHYKKQKALLGGVSRSAIGFFEKKNWPVISTVLKSTAFWVVLETLLVSAAQYYSSSFLNRPFGDLFNTGANYFGLVFFAPFLVVLLCILLKIDPLAQMDLITPAYPMALCLSKIACHFGGCCTGIQWEYGLYNPITRQIEFPAPYLEAGVALAIFVFLLCFQKKFRKGTVFPIYLMVYSGTRFFTEFLRSEPNVLFGLKTYHILCIVGVLVGAVEYILVRKYTSPKKAKA